MPIEITMPRLSDTMEEGTLVHWHVSVGDSVSAGDQLADVETDKATMELQAFDDGTVARLDVAQGKTVPVGQRILLLAGEGERIEEAAEPKAARTPAEPASSTSPPAPSPAEPASAGVSAGAAPPEEAAAGAQPDAAAGADQTLATTTTHVPSPGPGEMSSGRLRISPVARRMAEEKGLDPTRLTGSGPAGRIIKRDVLEAEKRHERQNAGQPAKTASSAPPAPAAPGLAPAQLETKTLELSSMRKTIAKRLVESKTTIPHFTVSMAVNMDPLLNLRQTLNPQIETQGIKLSVGDFITRAAALACGPHPMVNSSWTRGGIEQHGTVNMGIAVALPEERGGGLIVPVLGGVETLGLRQISQQTRQLAEKARNQGLTQEEMSGGTFTISNLGMFGVEHFEAIINPPQAAILAVGASLEKPVVREGRVEIGREMTVTLSADHRVVDGAIAAAYLQTLRGHLENPAGLLV